MYYLFRIHALNAGQVDTFINCQAFDERFPEAWEEDGVLFRSSILTGRENQFARLFTLRAQIRLLGHTDKRFISLQRVDLQKKNDRQFNVKDYNPSSTQLSFTKLDDM